MFRTTPSALLEASGRIFSGKSDKSNRVWEGLNLLRCRETANDISVIRQIADQGFGNCRWCSPSQVDG